MVVLLDIFSSIYNVFIAVNLGQQQFRVSPAGGGTDQHSISRAMLVHSALRIFSHQQHELANRKIFRLNAQTMIQRGSHPRYRNRNSAQYDGHTLKLYCRGDRHLGSFSSDTWVAKASSEHSERPALADNFQHRIKVLRIDKKCLCPLVCLWEIENP